VQLSNDNGANWTYLENTMTSDARWRMAAYRVEDILTPTAQMKIRFIASDSLRPTVNLSGGSLVEAAMDDFIVYDEYQEVNNVSESEMNWTLFPNPVENGVLTLIMKKHNVNFNNLIVVDVCGREVLKPLLDKGFDRVLLHCETLTPGYYFVKEDNLVIPFVVK
jgi:hypothetical protein